MSFRFPSCKGEFPHQRDHLSLPFELRHRRFHCSVAVNNGTQILKPRRGYSRCRIDDLIRVNDTIVWYGYAMYGEG